MKYLFWLESKRVLKSRTTKIAIAASACLSVALALLVISFLYYGRVDSNGNVTGGTGFDAIKAMREDKDKFEGYITAETARDAYTHYHEIYSAYGGEIPDDIYYREIWPIRSILSEISDVYDPLQYHEITPEQAAVYYEQRHIVQENKLFAPIMDNNEALEDAWGLEAQVEKPFYYVSYVGWENAGQYLTIAIFVVAIVCAVLVSPVFSADYQNGADAVTRCTRYGRTRLAVVKTLVSVFIALCLYALCIALYFGVVCAALGTDCFKAPIQILSAPAAAPISLGQLQWFTIGAGTLSILAISCFTTFISAKTKAPVSTLIVSIAVVLLPTFLRFGNNIGPVNIIKNLLPSGGVGLGNSIYNELLYELNYLTAGPVAVFVPYILVAAPIILSVLFSFLAIRNYNRHEVT